MAKQDNRPLAECEYVLKHEHELRVLISKEPETRKCIMPDGHTLTAPAKWLEVLDCVYEVHQEAALLVDRYRNRQSFIKVCRKHHMSPETLYRRMSKAKVWMAMLAVQEGITLIK